MQEEEELILLQGRNIGRATVRKGSKQGEIHEKK